MNEPTPPDGRLRLVLDAAIHALGDRASGPPFATEADVESHLRAWGHSNFSTTEVREGLQVLVADHEPMQIQGVERTPD